MMQHRDEEPKEENGWAAPEKTSDKEQFKTQELLEQFLVILNIMSPETMKQLVKRVKRLRVDTEEKLRGVINIIREKAMSEPGRSEAYAKMCCHLIGINVQSSTQPGGSVSFQKLLLHQCLTGFESVHDPNRQTAQEAADEELEWCVPEEEEEARAEAKRWFDGNIKFVGELFKIKLIRVAVMHEYISRLLSDSDEVSLEGLCQLLHAIGKDLDLSREKQALMDQHFSRMDRIVAEGRSSPRVCYMLQDLLNLRKNKWVLMRDDQGHDAEQDPREQVKLQQDVPCSDSRLSQRSRWKKAPRRRDRIRKSSSGEQDGSGEMDPTQPVHCQDNIENVALVQAEEPRDAEEELGSAGAEKVSENAKKEEFSEELEERKDSSPEVTSQVETQIQELDSSKTVESELTEESVKHEAPETETELQDDVEPRNSSNDIEVQTVESELPEESKEREVRPTEVTAQVDTEIQDDPDQNTSVSVEEKIELGEELQEDISELRSTEQTQEDSTVLDIPGVQNTADVSEPFECLEDPEERKHSSPEVTSEVGKEFLEQTDNQSSEALVCASVQQSVESEMGTQVHTEVRDDERQNDSDSVEGSVAQNEKLHLETKMSAEELTRHLDTMIQRKASNNEISDWIAENIDEQQTSSSMFVRTLMTCICQSAITYQRIYKVDIKLMCLRRRLLWKYVEGEEKELQALYALQALMVKMKHPNYLMQMFFDELYECDVISKDAFYKWESSQDPAEQDGKETALKSVTFFLTWLREIVEQLESY